MLSSVRLRGRATYRSRVINNMSSFVKTITVTCPAKIGDKLSDVDTPALIINQNAFERNLDRMHKYVSSLDRKVLLRPHAKTHKCAAIANLQIQKFGAVGMCCQKLDEAEALIDGGVRDVFVTNEIIGTKKIWRLCQLAKKANISVIVDSVHNVKELSEAAVTQGVELEVLIEVNGGQNRCGVNVHDGSSACVSIAKEICASQALRFKGIHCYGGSLQHVRSVAERRQLVMDGPVARAKIARDALAEVGISCDIITGAGTGTYPFEVEGGVHNELQPGSYAMMDVDYRANEDGKDVFEPALFVHTTVVSKAVDASGRAVVDAGMKALSLDSGPPQLFTAGAGDSVGSNGIGLANLSCRDVRYECGGDEHGILVGGVSQLQVGDMVRLIPGHVDPTVNMHKFFVVVAEPAEGAEPEVVDIWEIGGSGPGF